jgi:hypothetical protein
VADASKDKASDNEFSDVDDERLADSTQADHSKVSTKVSSEKSEVSVEKKKRAYKPRVKKTVDASDGNSGAASEGRVDGSEDKSEGSVKPKEKAAKAPQQRKPRQPKDPNDTNSQNKSQKVALVDDKYNPEKIFGADQDEVALALLSGTNGHFLSASSPRSTSGDEDRFESTIDDDDDVDAEEDDEDDNDDINMDE